MDLETAPGDMSLEQLAEKCAQESGRFFGGQSAPCPCSFELFRRALAGADQRAWEAIYRQYGSLVAGWVARHPAYRASGEEIQSFVNQAFERMWSAITPARFARFGDLRALLAYLKMCVHGAILDHARRAGPPAHELPEASEDLLPDRHSFEGEYQTREADSELWSAVSARLVNEKEKLVVQCLFVLDLKPRTIHTRYPEFFPDTREIYRIRQNVLERLSRDPDLRILGQEYA